MLGLAVKNVILFTLIILIFHFLIKNAIVDRKPPPAAPATLPISQAPQKPYERPMDAGLQETFVGQIKSERPDGPSLYDEEKKRMMSYVLQEEDTDLDTVFSQKIITECTKESCPKKTDESKLPLSTTCDANIQQLRPEDPMKLKADCKLPQDHKNFMLIKEYENEKDLNGGKLFDGLQAFDSYEDYFSQALPCGAA